jgi:hypothetical protein
MAAVSAPKMTILRASGNDRGFEIGPSIMFEPLQKKAFFSLYFWCS